MSDLEKLFEHAPEGATEIAVFPDGELRYATEGKTWYAPRWIARPHKWQTIATRPQPEPRKTVEDVVEWAERRWRAGETAICELDGELYFADNNLRMRNVICTREQFEACVANNKPDWRNNMKNPPMGKYVMGFFKSSVKSIPYHICDCYFDGEYWKTMGNDRVEDFYGCPPYAWSELAQPPIENVTKAEAEKLLGVKITD
ncbi:MAG: hypothetical protein COB03_18700 [Alteromonas sp.]|nr:MAG: hypothetical protein COB03_18700 [Alteromonas sp.]